MASWNILINEILNHDTFWIFSLYYVIWHRRWLYFHTVICIAESDCDDKISGPKYQ